MIVKIKLSENPKAALSKPPFVARLVYNSSDPDKCVEFVHPIERKCGKNGIIKEAEFMLEEGTPYIIRKNFSSHRNLRYTYELVIPTGGELKIIATITFINRSVVIEPQELKIYYAQYQRPIACLWAFYRDNFIT
jgi:hypothetical protein